MEQQALSDFSVTKCILAEPTNSSTVTTAATGCCSEQLEKNVNNNNILPAATEIKQEGDSTVSGK